jgi:hypothetical protein
LTPSAVNLQNLRRRKKRAMDHLQKRLRQRGPCLRRQCA